MIHDYTTKRDIRREQPKVYLVPALENWVRGNRQEGCLVAEARLEPWLLT